MSQGGVLRTPVSDTNQSVHPFTRSVEGELGIRDPCSLGEKCL